MDFSPEAAITQHREDVEERREGPFWLESVTGVGKAEEHRMGFVTAGWGQAPIHSRRSGAGRSKRTTAPGVSVISAMMGALSPSVTQRPVDGQFPGPQRRPWLRKSRCRWLSNQASSAYVQGELCGSLQKYLKSWMDFWAEQVQPWCGAFPSPRPIDLPPTTLSKAIFPVLWDAHMFCWPLVP